MEMSMCSKGRLLGLRPFTLPWAGWTLILALIIAGQTVLGPCLYAVDLTKPLP